MLDPLILATVLALKIPGGTSWMQKEESLYDIQMVAEAVWHEARDRSLYAQSGVAFVVLDRGSRHSRSSSIVETLSRSGQFPWWGKRQKRHDRLVWGAEALAWERAVMVATMAYASDDKTPLLPRPCAGSPTMFDDVKNQKRLGRKVRGCVVDGIVFWEE